MRTLSSSLTAAVIAAVQRPVVKLSAEDHINHFSMTITTSVNSDSVNDLCCANDGSLIRVRVTTGLNPFNQTFQWQRITDPSNVTQWQSWSTFAGSTNVTLGSGGCSVANHNGLLRAVAQQGSGGNALWLWTSSNNGVTWSSSPVTILSPPSSALVHSISSAGNNDLFFLYDVAGGCSIGCTFWNGSSWSALQSWTFSPLPNVGTLAMAWNSISNNYTVIYSDSYALKLCTVSATGTSWTTLPDIVSATTIAIQRYAPRLTLIDGLYTLTCCEIDSGSLTGSTYSYPRIRQSKDLLHWSNGFILPDLVARNGVTTIKTTFPGFTRATYIVASLPAIFYNNDYQISDSACFLNLSSRILSYQRRDQLDHSGSLDVILDNSDGGLTPFITRYPISTGTLPSSYQPIGLNTTLVLSEGYYTSTNLQETVVVGRYHITQINVERTTSQHQICLQAEDNTRLLDFQNRYPVTRSNQTLGWLLTDITARAGLFSINLPTSTQMNIVITTFILHAGQSYRQALNELCRIGWLEYYLDQNETLVFRELTTSDPSIWNYAPELASLTLCSDDQRANHVIIIGKPPLGSQMGAITSGEVWDSTHIHSTGQERLSIITDSKLTTSSLCLNRANEELAQEQRDQSRHQITVSVNPALQLLDVLTLSDQSPPVGTGFSTMARISRTLIEYQPAHCLYQMTIDLEGI